MMICVFLSVQSDGPSMVLESPVIPTGQFAIGDDLYEVLNTRVIFDIDPLPKTQSTYGFSYVQLFARKMRV